MAEGDNTGNNQGGSVEEVESRIALLETEIGLMREKMTLTEVNAEKAKNEVTLAEAKVQAELKRVEALKEAGALTEKQRQTHEATLTTLRKELDLQKKNLDNLEKSVAAGNQLSSVFGNYFSTLTGIDDTYKTTLLGSMLDAVTSAEGMQQAMEKTLKSMKAIPKLAIGTLLAQIEQSSIQVFTAMVGLNAELAKASGIGGKNFAATIQTNQRALSDWGASIEDSGGALKSLYTQFSGFRSLSKASQGTLHTAISQFAAIGVNADTATDFMDGLTKTFGITIPQAADLTNQFIGLAAEVKFTSEELMQSFTALNKDLAAFGDQSFEIFKKLIKQADTLGISMDKLVKVTSQFDTFDSAAEAVGKLNTMLGGNYVNMEKIMRADPAARFDMIRDAVSQAGVSFNNLNQFQARYLASAAGFDNVDDAMKAFNNTVVENDKTLEEHGLSQEKMKQLAKDSAGPMKLLSAAMQQLAIDMAPVVKWITDAVHWLATFIKENKDTIQVVALTTGVLFALWKVLQGFAAIKSVFKVLRGAGAAAAITAENAALSAKIPILTALTPVATAASAAMAGLGASMWPVVAAIAVVAVGIVAVVYILTEFFKVLVKSNTPILDLAKSMGIMAASIALVGLTGKLAFVGLVALGAGLLFAALGWLTMAPALASVATISENMKEIGGGDPFEPWTRGIKAFGNAVEDSESKLEKVSTVLASMSMAAMQFNAPAPALQFVRSVADIDAESVSGIQATKELIIQLNKASENDNIAALQKLIAEIKGLTKATGRAAAANQQDLKIELRDEVVGRVIRRHVSRGIG